MVFISRRYSPHSALALATDIPSRYLGPVNFGQDFGISVSQNFFFFCFLSPANYPPQVRGYLSMWSPVIRTIWFTFLL